MRARIQVDNMLEKGIITIAFASVISSWLLIAALLTGAFNPHISALTTFFSRFMS